MLCIVHSSMWYDVHEEQVQTERDQLGSEACGYHVGTAKTVH